MKLSTKKLFTSLKNSPKRKFKVNHKPKLSSPFVKINNTSKNVKQSLLPKQNNPIKNPFTKPEMKPYQLRNKNMRQIESSKNQVFHFLTVNENNKYNDNDYDDSYINNILLTSESDSNKFISEKENNYFRTEIHEESPKNDEIEDLCKLFKQSNLKGTIVIDEKGNNNLNVEQKNIINNYFDKKNKKNKKHSKINSIRVQEYKGNKNIFQQNISNVKTFSKLSYNNIKNNINFDINNGGKKKDRIIVHKKILSTKINNNESINLNESLIIKNDKNKEKEKDEKDITENNSIFETYRSIDSSFLGSSMGDVFF